jgi:hypothetical protein
MKGRFNIFQSGMLRWRELFPYNAVHVVRIDRPLDAARLRAVLDARLAALGLSGLTIDARHARFEYQGGPAHPELRVLPAGADATGVVCAEIERQLNEPFARDGRVDPFRFFAVDAGDSFQLGLAYDHVVAGGDSIALLQKDLSEHYAGAATGDASTRMLDRHPATYGSHLRRHPWQALVGLKSLWATLASGRRAFRPRYTDDKDFANGFAALRVERDQADRLRAAARAWGVTQNDVVLAMVLQALAPLTEGRRGEARRTDLAIASIINLRSEFGAPATTTFGQFLSSFHVRHAVPEGIGLPDLAREIHAQTARIRRERRYYQTLLGIAGTNLILRFLSPARRERFHAKSFPLWAGTTPLNADALWKEAGAAHPAPDYLRGVSTGPLIPLLVAVTTAGGALAIGLSYRTAAFTRENIAKIIAAIRDSIEHLGA